MSLAIFFLIFAASAYAEDPPPEYRTDKNKDNTLSWFQPVKGEFPPEGSAHYISGELVGFEHPERKLILRVDRNDSQSRALWDYSITATMLPYGSIYYNNQHAALQDIPIGTHLHGWFYERPEGEEKHWRLRNGKPHNKDNIRASPEVDFTRCIRLEDDFTYHSRRNKIWKVDKVDLIERKLTATLQKDGKPIGDPKLFDLRTRTIVYHENGFGTLETIRPGQQIQMNLTWVTLYGPGRVFEIWLDETSRKLAAARQLERHRNHIRERGIPGWVTKVDDEKQIVTIAFFDGLDHKLFKDINTIVPEPLGWPTSGGAKDDLKPKGTIAVARHTLMTYDIVNDRKGGNILATRKAGIQQGSSGVQIDVECGMLLEGYRPGEVVRFFPASWPVLGLPREETFFMRE